jgi:hypothetical protein
MHDGAFADWWYEQEERAGMREDSVDDDAGTNGAQQPSRFRFLTDVELENQPPQVHLVSDFLTVGALGVMAGPPATLKTTAAIDLACCVQSTTPWHGRTVRGGNVVYVAAEGIGGYGKRVRAWKRTHQRSGPLGLVFLPHAVGMIRAGEVDALLVAMERQLPTAPVLVVIDTLARCLVGGEENSARDVGLWIAGVDRIRAHTGAAVLVIHHTGKSGGQERGSSALRGAADTMILVEREDNCVTLRCDKQKDAAPFAAIRFVVQPVVIDEDGSTACVLSADEPDTGFTRCPWTLPDSRQQALDALRDVDHGAGATASEWLRASGIAERTFHRAVKDLLHWERVTRTGQRRSFRYSVSEAGNG